MKFYEFTQNNSGGSFHVNDDLTVRVMIEADTAEEANSKAEDLGMYWDGCEKGHDCKCCGDRWYPAWGDGMEFPYRYGTMTEKEAKEIAVAYNSQAEPNMRVGTNKDRNWDVIFPVPESYAQFVADRWGWDDPDCYIYFKDSRKVRISGKKEKP